MVSSYVEMGGKALSSPAGCFPFPRQFLLAVTSPDSMSFLPLAVCSFTWKPHLKGHSALPGPYCEELQLTALKGASTASLFWIF